MNNLLKNIRINESLSHIQGAKDDMKVVIKKQDDMKVFSGWRHKAKEKEKDSRGLLGMKS